MLTAEGPSVLEFNTRFGDPETQAVLPRLGTDLLALLWAAATGRLGGFALEVRPEHAICVVISAAGYPGPYPSGDEIVLPAPLPDGVTVLHAGTARDAHGRLVTSGGRVLGVTATGPTLREAASAAYGTCELIQCASKYYRRDVGARQLRRL
jgi:phosphoribosylamine--glycine ligase